MFGRSILLIEDFLEREFKSFYVLKFNVLSVMCLVEINKNSCLRSGLFDDECSFHVFVAVSAGYAAEEGEASWFVCDKFCGLGCFAFEFKMDIIVGNCESVGNV